MYFNLRSSCACFDTVIQPNSLFSFQVSVFGKSLWERILKFTGLIDTSALCSKNRSSVWLALAVITTKAEQTKKRMSSKQKIQGKGHHCWCYRNDCNLQKWKDKCRKRNSRITTWVKSCLEDSSGQVLHLKKAELASVRSVFSLLSLCYFLL